MTSLYTALLGILNIIGIYFLRNKIIDLIARLFQNLIKPIDYIIDFLTGSFSSISRLNYRQQVLNFCIVIVAIVLVWSEYTTLNEAVESVFSTELDGINFFGINIQWSIFTAISYIAIATVIGFIGLELIHFRSLLQGLLYNDIDQNNTVPLNTKRIIFVSFLFLILIVLAYLQGELAIYRYVGLSNIEELTAVNEYDRDIKWFFFLLGFLTPIIAALALMSLDIFLSIIAKFLAVILAFVQRILAAIFYGLEILIKLISSPIDKFLELFNIYQPENINKLNKDNVKMAQRLSPLGDSDVVFNKNMAELYNLYNINVLTSNSLVFISDYPKIKISIPTVDFHVKKDTKFSDFTTYLKGKYIVLNKTKLEYYYIDANGFYTQIDDSETILPYFKKTNVINIEIK